MDILVCVKRVPATGGQISLTADEQEIDTRYLGFTVSPHEECAVEEAVRLVEAHGGSTTVLTLGPAEAEDQLREAMAIGVDRAVLLETDGRDWDAGRHGRRDLTEAIRAQEAANGPFDLLLFGNESADSGDYQVGIRVAVALDRPCVVGRQGARGPRRDRRRRSATPAAAGRSTRCPCPAVVAVKEGINLPRYPSVPGRLRARKGAARGRHARRAGGRPREGAPHRAGARGDRRRDPGLGARGGAARRRGPPAARAGDAMILVLVEHADGRPERTSLEALAVARGLAGRRSGRPDRGAPHRRGRRGGGRLPGAAGRRDRARRRASLAVDLRAGRLGSGRRRS